MKGWLVISWNPWECKDIYKRVFLCHREAITYIANYNLNVDREEEIELHEVAVGGVSSIK